MNREDLHFVMQRKKAFAACCCVAGLMVEVVGKGNEGGNVVADLRECIGAWKTVRLG